VALDRTKFAPRLFVVDPLPPPLLPLPQFRVRGGEATPSLKAMKAAKRNGVFSVTQATARKNSFR
jgi:hypothetical protein